MFSCNSHQLPWDHELLTLPYVVFTLCCSLTSLMNNSWDMWSLKKKGRVYFFFTFDNWNMLSILYCFVFHKAAFAVNLRCLHAININVYLLILTINNWVQHVNNLYFRTRKPAFSEKHQHTPTLSKDHFKRVVWNVSP